MLIKSDPGWKQSFSSRNLHATKKPVKTYANFSVDDINEATQNNNEIEHIPSVTEIILQKTRRLEIRRSIDHTGSCNWSPSVLGQWSLKWLPKRKFRWRSNLAYPRHFQISGPVGNAEIFWLKRIIKYNASVYVRIRFSNTLQITTLPSWQGWTYSSLWWQKSHIRKTERWPATRLYIDSGF